MPPPDAAAPGPGAPPRPAPAEPHVVEFGYRGYRYAARVSPCAEARTEPLLVLGGALQSKDAWRLHEMDFATWATTVAIDVPGLGDADPLPVHHGLDFHADALRHALDRLAMPSVNVLGYSYGALIAYQLACAFPGRVARLALAGMGEPEPEQAEDAAEIREMARLLQDGAWDAFARRAADVLTRTTGITRTDASAAVQLLVHRQFTTLSADRTRQYLANLERLKYAYEHRGSWITGPADGAPLAVPTLLFTGAGDTLATPERVRAFTAAFADATFTTVRDSWHLALLERRAECTDLLRRFFTDDLARTPGYCTAIERLGATGRR
ncbi:alpha/beta fold hydrolase [Streptantibioticus cattleyicolor]|uniref:alpha/beta fold hydrolase n=1 Tax=Streptantibioticus cattleyicolor TaxID=29303 RepID=UPI0005A7DC0C|nr:alpha/beta fold hydrolase [Streptantibioticus cattleyicolor]